MSEKIIVDFTRKDNSVKKFEGEDFFYRLEIDSRILLLILEKKLSWEQLLLSLRFKASRNPDVYNEPLVVFLRFADPKSYEAFELYEKRKDLSDTFILNYEGKKYEVQKYCPHAMGDLSKGRIVDGCIVCPNHGWTFSISDGMCVSKNASIKIRQLEQEISQMPEVGRPSMETILVKLPEAVRIPGDEWMAEDRIRIVMESLTTSMSAAELCRKYNLAPGQFDLWKQRFIEGGKLALANFKAQRGNKDRTAENL
jgi:nitrite reductase/ring-hydroxylating ferredoxin subunit